IGDLSLLTRQELKKLLVDWNPKEIEYPNNKVIHQLFEEQAEKNPSKIAVYFQERFLTYHELNQKANQLGHYLREQGVNPGNFVAIYIERGLEMIIGILGILKAGGVYVPIDPESPMTRVEWILQDTACKFIVGSIPFKLESQIKEIYID